MKPQICLLLIVIFILLGLWTGINLGIQSMSKKAVKAGHAEYYLDANDQRQWRWKPLTN